MSVREQLLKLNLPAREADQMRIMLHCQRLGIFTEYDAAEVRRERMRWVSSEILDYETGELEQMSPIELTTVGSVLSGRR